MRKVRKSVNFRFGETKHRRLLVAQDVLAKLRAKHCKLLDDRRKAQPLVGGELGASAHEIEMVPLQYAQRFGRQAKARAPLEQCINPGEQRRIEKDRVPVPRHEGRHVTLDGLQLIIGVSCGQLRKHRIDPPQRLAAELQRRDGVVESRRIGLRRDRRHFALMRGQRLDIGRLEIGGRNRIKRRRPEWRRPGFKKRVAHTELQITPHDGATEAGRQGRRNWLRAAPVLDDSCAERSRECRLPAIVGFSPEVISLACRAHRRPTASDPPRSHLPSGRGSGS